MIDDKLDRLTRCESQVVKILSRAWVCLLQVITIFLVNHAIIKLGHLLSDVESLLRGERSITWH